MKYQEVLNLQIKRKIFVLYAFVYILNKFDMIKSLLDLLNFKFLSF